MSAECRTKEVEKAHLLLFMSDVALYCLTKTTATCTKWMSYLTPAGFMLAASGCESNVYVYDVRGRIVNAAGEAVANVPVHVETHTSSQPWNFWDGNEPVDGWDGKHDPAVLTDSAGRFQTEAIGDVYTSRLYPLLPEPTAPPLPKVRVWFGRGDGWCIPAEVTSRTPADQSRIGMLHFLLRPTYPVGVFRASMPSAGYVGL